MSRYSFGPQTTHTARWKPPALLTSYTTWQYCSFLHPQHGFWWHWQKVWTVLVLLQNLQPQLGSWGWSQWLSVEPAIIPASCPVFSYKLLSSRVLFSLRILHNLYLFAQCQLDVCFSAWAIFSFQNILHFREVFEQLFWEEIRQTISTQKLSYLLFLCGGIHDVSWNDWVRLVPEVRLVGLMEIGWAWQHTGRCTAQLTVFH